MVTVCFVLTILLLVAAKFAFIIIPYLPLSFLVDLGFLSHEGLVVIGVILSFLVTLAFYAFAPDPWKTLAAQAEFTLLFWTLLLGLIYGTISFLKALWRKR
jgi:hypothetical protein